LSKRRRQWFGQFPFPFRVFASSFLPVLRRVQRGSGGNLGHCHRARGRKSSPVPIFALRRLMFGSSGIGARRKWSFSPPWHPPSAVQLLCQLLKAARPSQIVEQEDV